jgi:hypothetical protein
MLKKKKKKKKKVSIPIKENALNLTSGEKRELERKRIVLFWLSLEGN